LLELEDFMMELKRRLQQDMADAMRQGDAERRNTLRMLLAAVQQVEVDERRELDDAGVLAVLQKQAKQRRESVADAHKAGRADLAAQEEKELAILEDYLPQMATRDEVQRLATAVIAELGVTDVKGLGQVMNRLMPQLKDRADGRLVNEVARGLLQNG
jgi:uncharacterized protein YqeY